MKAVAFSNNDIAVAAWTFGGRLEGCLGFAIYRIDVKAGTETCLPALATFPDQQASPNRTTAQDPVQKFFWKDVYARRGGSYRYRIVPMAGAPGALIPMSVGALTTNIVQLTPDYGVLSAYFNRGMLATQATAHALHENGDLDSMKQELLRRIADESDQLRIDLAGDMIEAMTMLPKEAAEQHGKVWCALYEFEDAQLIGTLTDLAGNANVILSNMPGKVDGARTDDTYAPERKKARASRVNVIDRMMPGGHIGHNKFTILDDGGPKAVQFGSTNWTDRALCAQSNNTIIARSPGVAAAYMKYWNDLKTDTEAGDGKGKQASSLRSADGAGPVRVDLEDGSGTVDLWFSPNTKTARQRNHAKEPTPPDLQQVFDLIAGAKQAVLFVAFEPGTPSIIDAIAKAQDANPALFVRGTVTVAKAAQDFAVAIKSDAVGDGNGAALSDDWACGKRSSTRPASRSLTASSWSSTRSRMAASSSPEATTSATRRPTTTTRTWRSSRETAGLRKPMRPMPWTSTITMLGDGGYPKIPPPHGPLCGPATPGRIRISTSRAGRSRRNSASGWRLRPQRTPCPPLRPPRPPTAFSRRLRR
jgi:hypothetical protein